MKNQMLAHIAGIKSEVTALEAEVLLLPGEFVAEEDPGLEIPDDLEPPLEPPLPPVITLPMHVRDVKLSAEQVKLIERLTNCSTFKPGGTREAYNLDGLSKSGRLNDVSRHLSLGGAAAWRRAVTYWSWILTAVGVTGLMLSGSHNKTGWLIGLGAQILWFAYALATRQYGFVVSAFAYGFVYSRNFWKWRSEELEASR